MKDEQIEKAFIKTLDTWNAENPHYQVDLDNSLSRMLRYHFFAGSEFGLASAKEIYNESHSEKGKK